MQKLQAGDDGAQMGLKSQIGHLHVPFLKTDSGPLLKILTHPSPQKSQYTSGIISPLAFRPLKRDSVFNVTCPHYENCATFDNQKSKNN